MPSSDFLRLVGTLDDEPQIPTTSLVRTFWADNMTVTATDDQSDPEAALKRLPSDAVGFCMPQLPPILLCACTPSCAAPVHNPEIDEGSRATRAHAWQT